MLYAPEKLNLFGSDTAKCLFCEKGWYEKAVKTMDGWTNLTRIDEFEQGM